MIMGAMSVESPSRSSGSLTGYCCKKSGPEEQRLKS